MGDPSLQFTTPGRLDEWSEHKTVEDWANESLDLAKQAYKEPRKGTTIKTGQVLGEEYQEWAIEKVEKRLARAGVRVADILNKALIDSVH